MARLTRRTILETAAVAALGAKSALVGERPGEARTPTADLRLWYNQPAASAMNEALPIGNGRLGAVLFGAYWSGFDLPRHLTHFTPATMGAMVDLAGGVLVGAEHKSKARYFLRSLRHRLADDTSRRGRAVRAVLENGLGGGVVKLGVELLSPLGEWSRRGEAVRYFIRRRADGEMTTPGEEGHR